MTAKLKDLSDKELLLLARQRVSGNPYSKVFASWNAVFVTILLFGGFYIVLHLNKNVRTEDIFVGSMFLSLIIGCILTQLFGISRATIKKLDALVELYSRSGVIDHNA